MRIPSVASSTPAPMLSRRRRSAFTLLEVLLSAAIGVLLLGGLYVAVEIQLRHAQTARDVVEQSTLARSVLGRIAMDIRPTLAPPLPVSTSSSSGSGSGSGQGAGGTGGTTGGTTGSGTTSGGTAGTSGSGSGSSASGGSTSSPSSTASSTNTTQQTPVAGNGVVLVAVQGDNSRLTIMLSRVPREVFANTDTPPVVSDLRRVTYWLINSGDTPLGLARQEVKVVTSDDLMSTVPPDVPDEQSYLIAEEIKSLTFRYFDGQNWQDTWDASAAGADGTTPMGPPLAVEIVIGLAPPGAVVRPNVQPDLKTFRHVVAIPTANGAPQSSNTTGQ